MNRLTELQSQLLEQIKASPAFQSAVHWYQALPARDRLVVRLVAGLMGAALVFLLLYAPLLKAQRAAEGALKKNLATYNLLADNAGRFGSVAVGGGAQAPLLATVTQQAKAAGISLSRYEQDGKSLRVWLDKVNFDEAIGWLERLQAANGITVSQVTIDRSERAGVVDIRATLGQ